MLGYIRAMNSIYQRWLSVATPVPTGLPRYVEAYHPDQLGQLCRSPEARQCRTARARRAGPSEIKINEELSVPSTRG